MKKAVMALAILALAGCARPYGPTTSIINNDIVKPDTGKQQTKIKIMRVKQFTESFLSPCTFDVEVDGQLVAFLEQNQYVTVYLDNGVHSLGFSDSCYSKEKTGVTRLKVITRGTPQEYSTKIGAFGQFLMWRTL